MSKWNLAGRRVFIVFMVAGFVLVGACSSTELPTNTSAGCQVSAAEFDSWFKSGSVSLNGEVVPADGLAFPNTPNCSFFEWSEQMFLWVTSPSPPSYGGGSAPIFNSPAFYTITPQEDGVRRFKTNKASGIANLRLREAQFGVNNLPFFVQKKTLKPFEIIPAQLNERGQQLMLNKNMTAVPVMKMDLSKPGRPIFFDVEGKRIDNARPIFPKHLRDQAIVQKFHFSTESIFLDAFGQVIEPEVVQASGHVVMAQEGSLVYYTTTVNQVYAYFLTGVKNNAIDVPAPSSSSSPLWENAQFPTTQQNLDDILAFASANNATLVDPEALAIEVKTSWVETTSVEDPSQYITMDGEIPTYSANQDNTVWTQTGTKITKLALVGIHVVGSTANHPELLWSTFEHVGNTPNVAYSIIPNQNNAEPLIPSDTNQGGWLLSSANSTGPFNQSHMHSGFTDPATILANDGFDISPSDIIREFPWGTDPDNASLNTQVITMNNSVRDKLLNGDVRKNYIQIGTTWTANGVDPSDNTHRGTEKLANSTMETYDIGTNCFSCHGSNKVRVSHIFAPTEPLFPPN